MNRQIRYYAALVLLLNTVWHAHAQEQRAAIKVIARAQENRIMLRWAPDQAVAWRQANRYGYMIERYTIVRDGQLLATPEKHILTDQPLRPQPLNNWKDIVQQSDYAAVLAQALYGTNFEVSSAGNKNTPASIVALSEEQEQRFGLALYAADLDFQAAQMAALAYTEKDIRKGERYLYRIYVPATGAAVPDTGSVYIDPARPDELPCPQGLVTVPGNRVVLLSWDYSLLRRYYNNYIVERSADGVHYQKLGNLPLTNLNDKENRKAATMYYTDTLPENNKRYLYRVSGLNAFGEKGPASDTAGATGVELLVYVPFITATDLRSDRELKIDWTCDNEANPLLKEFVLNVADKAAGPYRVLQRAIRPEARSFTYLAPKPLEGAYYYTVTAVPLNGQPRTSFPVLVQTIDSIPPAPPTGLKGYIDSAGIVRLSWKPNTEKDILGYRIYRAVQDGEEFSGINAEIFSACKYTDTVQVMSLNNTTLYRIVAVDKHFNNSAFSEILRLKKPDMVPPSPAAITGYEINANSISISWQPGSSPDAQQYILFRYDGTDTSKYWEVDRCTPAGIKNPMRDNKVVAGSAYTYFIETADSSGLKSNSPQRITLTAARYNELQRPGVRTLNVFKDQPGKYLDLYWQYDQTGVQEFQVYRAAKDEPLTLWKTIAGNTFRVRDADVRPGKQYRYAVKAQFADGAQSKMVSIQIEY